MAIHAPILSAACVPQTGSVETVDGQTLSGAVEFIDRQGNISGTNLPNSLKLSSALRIKTGLKKTAITYPIAATLADSNRPLDSTTSSLGIHSAKLANEEFEFKNESGPFKLPLQTIRALVWSSSETIKQAIAKPSKNEDRVFVQIGDRQQTVPGIIESITDETVAINYKNELRTIKLEKVKAVVFADVGLKRPPGVFAHIETRDGSTWKGVIQYMLAGKATPDEVYLNLELADEASINLARQNIVSINIDSDRIAFLSDMKPVEVRESTDFAVPRPFQINRSVTGNKLRILGDNKQALEFQKGLGTQATSRLDFQNDRGFTRFFATVGMDLGTRERGDCEVIIQADGIQKWRERVVAGEGPKSIDVDISQSERVSLIVRPGREFDLADHINWCNPRFVKTDSD